MADRLQRRYVSFYVIVLIGIFVKDMQTAATRGDVKDYCNNDSFEAVCGSDEVIVITSALYGRMREGRCIFRNNAQSDCYIDVIDYLHQTCSGRQECSILVGKIEFDMKESSPSCFNRYVKYLEASFTCEKVLVPRPNECMEKSVLCAPSPRGSIASSTIPLTGDNECPWSIRLPTGQRIKIKVYDYSSQASEGDGLCDVIAVVREPDYKISETVCSGLEPGRVVYTSVGNSLEMRILSKKQSETPSAFILKYEALGCPDLLTPLHGWLEREGNTIEWGCHEGKTLGKLQCRETEWNGSPRNCSVSVEVPGRQPVSKKKDLLQTVMDSPTVFPLVLSAALVLLIGIILCTTGLCFVVRYKIRTPNHDSTDPASFYYSTGPRSQKCVSGEYLQPMPPGQSFNTTGRVFSPTNKSPLSNTNTLPLRLPPAGPSQNQSLPPRNGLPAIVRVSQDDFEPGTNRSNKSYIGVQGQRYKEHVYDVPLMTSEEELRQEDEMLSTGRPESETLLANPDSRPHTNPRQ